MYVGQEISENMLQDILYGKNKSLWINIEPSGLRAIPMNRVMSAEAALWLRLTYPKGITAPCTIQSFTGGRVISYSVLALKLANYQRWFSTSNCKEQSLPACDQMNTNIWILLPSISWVEKTGLNTTLLVENCSQLHCRENYWSQPATPHSAGKVPFGRERLIHLQG